MHTKIDSERMERLGLPMDSVIGFMNTPAIGGYCMSQGPDMSDLTSNNVWKINSARHSAFPKRRVRSA